MDKRVVVQDLLMQMRATLANEDRLPQSFVDSRVMNLSAYLQTLTVEQSEPFDWAALSDVRCAMCDVRRDASY